MLYLFFFFFFFLSSDLFVTVNRTREERNEKDTNWGRIIVQLFGCAWKCGRREILRVHHKIFCPWRVRFLKRKRGRTCTYFTLPLFLSLVFFMEMRASEATSRLLWRLLVMLIQLPSNTMELQGSWSPCSLFWYEVVMETLFIPRDGRVESWAEKLHLEV